MIRVEDMSPEEHLAAHGTRADHRVKVWRQTYGPGKRHTGARFRDEVRVCSGCCGVTATRLLPGPECFGTTGRTVRRMDAMSPDALRRWGHRLSDAQLREQVQEPCRGTRMSPTAELGYRWLEGTRLR